MDVLTMPLGSEGTFEIDLAGGKVIIKAQHNHASGSAAIVIEQDAKYFLEKLKGLIPGTIDDMLIEIAKNAIP